MLVHALHEPAVEIRVLLVPREPVEQPSVADACPEPRVLAAPERLLRPPLLRFQVGLVEEPGDAQGIGAELRVEGPPRHDRRAGEVAPEQAERVVPGAPRIVDALHQVSAPAATAACAASASTGSSAPVSSLNLSRRRAARAS